MCKLFLLDSIIENQILMYVRKIGTDLFTRALSLMGQGH